MFTESDIKKILRTVTGGTNTNATHPSSLARSQLPNLPPSLESVSGGLILEKHARSVIEKAIFSDKQPNRISLLELASKTNLEVKNVEFLLPPQDRPEWGRVGYLTVIRKEEYTALQEKLQQRLTGGIMIVSEFCKEAAIDQQFFRKLLRESFSKFEIEWPGNDGDLLCTTSFYEDCKSVLRRELVETSTPRDLSSFLSDRQLPSGFTSSLLKVILKENGSDLGILKGTVFTPNSYIESRRNSLIERIQHDTIIDLESIRREGIDNVEKFLRDKLPGLYFLEAHVVTTDYVNKLTASTQMKLDTEGWAAVGDTRNHLSSGDQHALILLLRGRLGNFELHAGRLVSITLKHTLIQKAVECSVQQAQLASKAKTKGDIRAQAFRLQDLSQFLSASSAVPLPVLTSLLDSIYPIALDSFNNRIARLQDELEKNIRDTFLERGYARFHIHYDALQSITDTPLRSKLAADLVDYCRETVLGQLEKYEMFMRPDVMPQSIMDFKVTLQNASKSGAKPEQLLKIIERELGKVMTDMGISPALANGLENQKEKFISDLKIQLQKTTDASLALTLTLILLHAGLSPGVLRASGKYVPKLLKLLQGKIDQQVMDDLVSLKTAVVSRAQFSEEDFNRLRQIGDRSDRFGSQVKE